LYSPDAALRERKIANRPARKTGFFVPLHVRSWIRNIGPPRLRKALRIIRIAAAKVHNASEKEQKQWGTHSIRVGALVRLQLMGQPEHFIQARLRWKSDRWKEYLRNLPQLANTHTNVVNALAEELASLKNTEQQ